MREHLPRVSQPRDTAGVLRCPEQGPGIASALLHFLRSAGGEEIGEEVLGNDDGALAQVVGDVLDLRIGGDGEVRRDGPGCGGPDGQRERVALERGRLLVEPGAVQHAESDVDRRAGPLRVFHFGFGQRRAVARAPVHRALSPVEGSLARDGGELADDLRLVPVVHGEVRIVPARQDAQAQEPAPLHLDLLLGELPAGAAEVARAHVPLLRPELLVDLQLDGQAVAVPARDEVRELAAHRGVLHHDVLEHLVEEVPQVDRAVGVRRPVVEDELLAAGVLAQDLLVDLPLLPRLHLRRLPLRELRTHGEARPGQVDRILEVHGGKSGRVAARGRSCNRIGAPFHSTPRRVVAYAARPSRSARWPFLPARSPPRASRCAPSRARRTWKSSCTCPGRWE